MSITFRKRPDHTLSTPEAKEPHLDLHSIDVGQADALDDDDIPVLLPAEPDEAVRHTVYTPAPNRAAAAASTPSTSPDRSAPILKRETASVHIPPPPSVSHHTPTHTAGQVSTPTSAPASARATPQATMQTPRVTEATHATAQAPARPVPPAPPVVSAATRQHSPESPSFSAAPELPGHPTTQDYAPFLNTAKNRHDSHNKPELYVWSDDENDAFAQVAKRDFTLNRIEPTAGRPSFDASLFRAPSRPQALASAAAPASVADTAAAMQAEIDALVTELLDESHDYLKRRFLEEIPEIIAKYRQR